MKKTFFQNKWMVCMAVLSLFIIPYFVINHSPLHQKVLPFILGEENIAFMPWTLVVYISLFLQVVIVIFYLPEYWLKKAFMFATVIVALHLTIFIWEPIRYPREFCPTENNFIKFLRQIDTEGNCFPSLHVSVSLLVAFFFSLYKRMKFSTILMWGWTLVIIASVLTTKQHYAIDIIGAVVLTGLTIFTLKDILKPSA